MNLRDLCAKYHIKFKKRLGQNLLLDDNINRLMTEAAALTPQDDVIEAGAGLGALTHRLAAQAGRVLAVEIDPAFVPVLEDQFRDQPHVRIFRGDILNHSLVKLAEEFLPGGASFKMVSNLPYYITTPLLFHFLESPVHFERLVVMVQEEVALRLTATVGSHDYGVLALAAQYRADVDIVRFVPRTCFVPQPKVDSNVVRFRCRDRLPYPEVDARFLMGVIRTAFGQRRKTLRNSLMKTGGFGVPHDIVEQAFEAAEIDPGRRPQTLSLDEFARLAIEMKRRMQES